MGQTNYAASKAGVIGLTKALAKELARDGVRVHCVLPGFINTPMAQAVPDKVLAQMEAQIPLGRFGEASEVASLVRFLVSDDASYLTGTVNEVSGGLWM